MADLRIERTGEHEFTGHNTRGASVRVGRAGGEGSFTPGELLQLSAAACAVVTVEQLVVRRTGEDARFAATASAEKNANGHEYDALHVDLDVDLSSLDEEARERLVAAIRSAVERECTVSRTVEKGVPVELGIATGDASPSAAGATTAAIGTVD